MARRRFIEQGSWPRIAAGGLFHWGVWLKDGPDEPIGVISFRPGSDKDQRGFWLCEDFQGRGLMTEAADRVVDFAFDEVGLDHLILTNALANVRSDRVKGRGRALFASHRTPSTPSVAYSPARSGAARPRRLAGAAFVSGDIDIRPARPGDGAAMADYTVRLVSEKLDTILLNRFMSEEEEEAVIAFYQANERNIFLLALDGEFIAGIAIRN